ncbi:MAG: hypothetical protein JWN44_4478 [Myxococcales bacterium]|nr:hypothetical protein [Myxococcales bacterium]
MPVRGAPRFWLLAIALLGACRAPRERDAAPAAAPAAEHRERAATAPAAPRNAGFLGVVVAPQTVDVSAQVAGRLLAVTVRVGDHVQRDAVLARLDGRSAVQEVKMARAELATALAARDQARLDIAQARERAARRSAVVELPSETVGTASAEEVSSAQYQVRLGQAKLDSAEAAVAQRRARLQQMAILAKEGALRAPFEGVVVARYVDAGSSIRQSMPVVRLLETGELRVRFAMPEDADELAVGTAVRVSVGAEAVDGVVEKVTPEIDAASRMIFAEASLAPRHASLHPLRSGQVARVSVPAAGGGVGR